MAEEDKNSSPLDEGTEIIAHTAQTAYATTAAVAAGGTAAGMAAGTALAGHLRSLRIYVTGLKKFCSRKITKKKS